MKFTFELVLDPTEGRTKYSCLLCGVSENGGPIGNPGLFGRMRQHLREADDLPKNAKLEWTAVRTSHVTFTVTGEVVDYETVSEATRPMSATATPSPALPDRHLYLQFLVDTNCVNARLKSESLNRLERWAADGLIRLLTTRVAQREMIAGNDAARLEKAYSFVFTESSITTPGEAKEIVDLGFLLFPGGPKNQNQRNDVEIVFNAGKYMSPLITADGASKSQPGGILGARAALAGRGIKVLRPEEAVAEVEAGVQLRDRLARQIAAIHGFEAPEWVGRD